MSDARHLALVTILVRDYDEAIAWFCDRLGFVVKEDTALSADKRWVIVAPSKGDGAGLLLAQAANDDQRARIGDQAGGRVFLFLRTDDFERDHARMTRAGVRFTQAPRHEAYGSVAVFEDLCGNLWDLLGPPRSPAA